MKPLPAPAESLKDIHSRLVCQTMVWSNLRDRVERTGERDAELLERRNNAMAIMCDSGGLLDQYVLVKGLAEIGHERATA